MSLEYLGLSAINGPLVVLEGVKNASFDEIVKITVDDNIEKIGRIVELYEDKAVIQVFQGTDNMSLKNKLEILGIDPIDMGTNRLERLAKELSKNKDCSCYSEYQDVIPNNNIQETSVATTMSNRCSSNISISLS